MLPPLDCTTPQGGAACVNKLISWLDCESDIYEKSLLSEIEFDDIKSEMARVRQCIDECLRACKEMTESNHIAYRHHSAYSARLSSAENEFKRKVTP